MEFIYVLEHELSTLLQLKEKQAGVRIKTQQARFEVLTL
jgi:hypothetical protein